MPFKYPSMQARIIANTVLSTERFYNGSPCWEWIGKVKINRNGAKYGVLSQRFKRGPRKGQVNSVLVHRLVLQVFKGRRMSRRNVGRHLCNYTLCANPEHLVGGTQQSNVRQCVREGRHRNGRTSCRASRKGCMTPVRCGIRGRWRRGRCR